MFYERYAGRIVAELSGVVLSIGLINLTYEFSRDTGLLGGLAPLDLICLLAMVAMTCALSGYHTLAFRIDMALPDAAEADVAHLSATRVIALYLIDLASLASLAGMFGILATVRVGEHLAPAMLAWSATFAAAWHALMALWYVVRCGGPASNARYHAAFTLWYALFAAVFFQADSSGLAAIAGVPGLTINLHALAWVAAFGAAVGLLYFGRFRKTVARGVAYFERDEAIRP